MSKCQSECRVINMSFNWVIRQSSPTAGKRINFNWSVHEILNIHDRDKKNRLVTSKIFALKVCTHRCFFRPQNYCYNLSGGEGRRGGGGGGGTLCIFGWGCASGTLRPLPYTIFSWFYNPIVGNENPNPITYLLCLNCITVTIQHTLIKTKSYNVTF